MAHFGLTQWTKPVGRVSKLLIRIEYGGQGWNRTTDTRIFSPLLYRLSYLAIIGASHYRIFTSKRITFYYLLKLIAIKKYFTMAIIISHSLN